MTEFLAMGGYAAFVWPAWGAGVVILLAITAHTFSRRKRAQTRLAMLEEVRKDG